MSLPEINHAFTTNKTWSLHFYYNKTKVNFYKVCVVDVLISDVIQVYKTIGSIKHQIIQIDQFIPDLH